MRRAAACVFGTVAAGNAGVAGLCWWRTGGAEDDDEPPPPRSRVEVTSVFKVHGAVAELFPEVCNPRLLNRSTPGWFRLSLRAEDPAQRGFRDIDAFFAGVESGGGTAELDTDRPAPLYLRYWNIVGCFVFPWISRVRQMRVAPDPLCGGCPSVQMAYQQHCGPYVSFTHTYNITQCPNEPGHAASAVVRDVITADMGFHGAPWLNRAANAVTGFCLQRLLASRCAYFVGERGGESIVLRVECV